MRQSPKDLEGSPRIGSKMVRKALDDLMEWKKAHHGKMSADETLIHLFNTLVTNLFELKDAKSSDEDRFAYGQKTAYVEVLEILQEWKDAKETYYKNYIYMDSNYIYCLYNFFKTC